MLISSGILIMDEILSEIIVFISLLLISVHRRDWSFTGSAAKGNTNHCWV